MIPSIGFYLAAINNYGLPSLYIVAIVGFLGDDKQGPKSTLHLDAFSASDAYTIRACCRAAARCGCASITRCGWLAWLSIALISAMAAGVVNSGFNKPVDVKLSTDSYLRRASLIALVLVNIAILLNLAITRSARRVIVEHVKRVGASVEAATASLSLVSLVGFASLVLEAATLHILVEAFKCLNSHCC